MHSIECPACKLYNKTNQLKCFREVKYKKVFIVICNCFLHWLQARAFVMQKPLNVLFYLLLQIYSWLPVRQRVIYKALLTHKVRATATPVYLSDLVQTHVPTRALHSSVAPLLVVPRKQTELARCTFSVAAPSVWNSLPADIKLC